MDALEREICCHKKGMSAALALAAYKNSELFSYSFDQLTQAVGALLDRAIAAGEIRNDITPKTSYVPLLACATCMISRAGRPASCALSTSSSTGCASDRIDVAQNTPRSKQAEKMVLRARAGKTIVVPRSFARSLPGAPIIDKRALSTIGREHRSDSTPSRGAFAS